MAGFVLGRDEHERGARHVSARFRIRPGQAGQAVFDGEAHQLVPGGMELDFVDAMSETIVRAQRRRILVGLKSPADGFFAAASAPEILELCASPWCAFAAEGVGQHAVRREQIVIR